METQIFTQNKDQLERPLWQLSTGEYCNLMRSLLAESGGRPHESAGSRQAVGMKQLAEALGCSASQLYVIRQNVDFSSALISFIGRKPVYSVEVARKLANDYMTRARQERQR